jgi:hypothetical protein
MKDEKYIRDRIRTLKDKILILEEFWCKYPNDEDYKSEINFLETRILELENILT